MNSSETILEYHRIKEMLCNYAVSEQAKQQLTSLAPYLSERECKRRMQETTDARRILDSCGTPPLPSMQEMQKYLALCEKSAMLSPAQLEAVARFIVACRRVKQYLKKAQMQQSAVAAYGQSICDLSALQEELEAAIQNGAVVSEASAALRDIRRKMENTGAQIKKRLEDLLRSKKNFFSDGYVSVRNGHYVLPVKKEYKNQISGSVIDISGTGGTCFIEPSAVAKMQSEISALEMEEENEVHRILYQLTAQVDDASDDLRRNIEAIAVLDFLFAKAKLSAALDARPVSIGTNRMICLRQARHPLLAKEKCVPLDFSIGETARGIVITGPNTGGKTVALKTVGLLSMMAQSGLHVPVKEGTFCMHNLVLCDIGDGQSITENLSTFSAHLKNMIEILRTANEDSLVLLDELGSGTDPAEGMGIAVAVLEELRQKNCLFIATTHYPEVKEYAAVAEGLQNARMAFDKESLQPLYRMEIGAAGESCALSIAERLGFPAHLLRRAKLAAYGGQTPQKDQESFRSWEAFEEPVETAPPLAQASVPLVCVPKILRGRAPQKEKHPHFSVGDSVVVYPEKQLGIVFQPCDDRGRVGVQIKGEKNFVGVKRVKLKTPAKDLYPPDYDFSILFDSVAVRKAHRKMGKRHDPNLEIQLEQPGHIDK